MKKYLKYLLLFTLCICEEVLAGVFDVIPTDKSKEYLGLIFGGNVGAVTLGGGANPMLSKMFERFNFIIVAAGVIVLSYIAIVSAINTAREGEAMGKKFSIWVPLRGLFGMLLMVPTPGSGYSVIQMTIIWIVLNGIGAANAVWNVVLDQISLGIKAVGKIDIQIGDDKLWPLASAVLRSSACMTSINQMPNLDFTKNYGPVKKIVVYSPIQFAPNSSDPTTLSQTANIYVGVTDPSSTMSPHATFGNVCGVYEVTTSICKPDPQAPNNGGCMDTFNQSSMTQRLNIKVNAVLAMFDVASGASAAFTAINTSTDPLAAPPPPPPPGYVHAMCDAYRSGIAGLAGGVKVEVGRRTGDSNLVGPQINARTVDWGAPQQRDIRFVQNANGDWVPLDGPHADRTAAGYAGITVGDAKTAEEIYASGGTLPSGTPTRYDVPQGLDDRIERAGANLVNPVSEWGAGAEQTVVNQGVDVANWAVNRWEQEPQPVAVTNQQVDQLRRSGWIHAGSYYYSLAKSSASNISMDELTKFATPKKVPVATSYDLTQPGVRPEESQWSNDLFIQLQTVHNRVNFNLALKKAMDYWQGDLSYVSEQLPALGSGSASTGNEFMDQVVNAVSAGFRQPIMDFFINELGGQGAIVRGAEDPLITIGRFGWTIMIAGEIAIFAVIALCFALLLLLAVGSCMSSMAWAANALFMQLFSLIFGIIVLLWTAGATLGVYVPMIPYLIFTGAAVGWFMSVAEALVGGPIIALALTHPSGEELGKMGPGIGIIASIFLRPTLMIFGFILAAGILRASLTMVNFGFMIALNDSVLPTIFNIIPTLGLYAFFVVGIVNQAFSLIYVLPNKVLRYIGITGEEQTPEAAKKAEEGFKAGGEVGQQQIQGMFDKGKEGLAKQMGRAEASKPGWGKRLFGREGLIRGDGPLGGGGGGG